MELGGFISFSFPRCEETITNILHSGGLWETWTKAPRKREGPSGAITTECYQPQTLGS
jgi:hypothetical protein